MSMYPGPPAYYAMPEEKQTRVLQNCEWSTSSRASAVSTKPWMKVAVEGAQTIRAPQEGKSREAFIRALQDELSKHGPVVLSLEMHGRAKCCEAGTCSSEEQQDTCGRHAVVLHGWKIDPKTKKFFWIAQNAWGASKLPKWMSGVDTDKQGRTLYPDSSQGIRPGTLEKGTMVAFSYTTFIPDTDHYLATVSLRATVDPRAVRPLSVGETFKSLKEKKMVRPLLPDCTQLSSHAGSPSSHKTKLGQLRAIFGGTDNTESAEHAEEAEFDVTSCEIEASTIYVVKVTATVPKITYKDSEGSLSLRLRLRPPHGHCSATKDLRSGGRSLSLRGECTKLSKAKCLKAFEEYAKCQWINGPRWGEVGEDADDDEAGGESDVELRPRAVVVKDWVGVSQTTVRAKLFLPSFNPRTRFSSVQKLKVPLDYVTLELLGWSYESYNKPPSFFSTKAKSGDVRANGEGASGQGTILRTTDVFLGKQYTDIKHACNPQSRIEHFCNGGQDRQCVRALGRYLDRAKLSIWTQAERGGGGKRREWREEDVTVETLHAGNGARDGSCLHFASLDKCLPLCGNAMPTMLTVAKVSTGFFSKEERPCAGFRLPGGEKICLNDVSKGVPPSSENVLQRDNSMLIVCLATRWASLKVSPLPDKQHEALQSSSGCPWSSQ